MNAPSRETKIINAFVNVTDTLVADFDVVELLHTLVGECIGLVDTNAGGLMLADSLGGLQLVASTSEAADFVETMQLTAGDGPCVESFETGKTVVVADIAKSGAQWPAFQKAALGQGFHSLHSTPLRLRGKVIGTMNLFSTRPGELSPENAAVVQALTDVATLSIMQERLVREANMVAEQLQHALDSRILIEQAKGVISQRGSMNMDEAFQALRSYARNNNLSLHLVAEGVTNQTLDVLAPGANRRE